MMIDGRAHGPEKGTATCQLHLRKLTDGAVITVEPWRAAGFPIIKDLAVDRSAFDRIVEAGGYITAPTGAARDANEILVPKEAADAAMDAAACIGCGACVAACPNSAAQLFTAAKYSHLSLLPQGQPERYTRVVAMVEEMERYFGSCTNHGECEQACPKEISIDFIALLNRDYVKAQFKNTRLAGQTRLSRAGAGPVRDGVSGRSAAPSGRLRVPADVVEDAVGAEDADDEVAVRRRREERPVDLTGPRRSSTPGSARGSAVGACPTSARADRSSTRRTCGARRRTGCGLRGSWRSSSSSGTTTIVAWRWRRCCRQGLLWLAVELSTATVGAQLPTTSTAGSHDTTRHAMRPTVATCWLHWPYRNCVQPALRLLQSPFAQPQPHGAFEQLSGQIRPVPQRQVALQSM